MTIQFAVKPNSTPLTITGDFDSFNEAAGEIRTFLFSKKAEISIPIADKDYPYIRILLGTGMVNIRVIPKEGILITGEQQYLDMMAATFDSFDSKDREFNIATLGPKYQSHWISESSDAIALEAT